MTQDQTRALGIEFERRCQTIDPTMEYIGKMDTDDIYSYLNQFVVQYIKQAYQNKDKAVAGTPEYDKIIKILDGCKQTAQYTYPGSDPESFIPLFVCADENEILEILSLSLNPGTNTTYSGVIDLASLSDIQKLESTQNSNYILKHPLAGAVDNDFKQLMVFPGSLYNISIGSSISATIIAIPNKFYPNKKDGTDRACVLPALCFDDIVTGAVQLYFNHKAALTRSNKSNDKQTEES